MLLSHYELNEPLVFHEGIVNVLVIEKPNMMAKFIEDLSGQFDKKDGNFELFDNNTSISISDNVMLLINPFSANVNERDILNKLYAIMKKDALDEDLYLKTNSFLSEIENNIRIITERQPIPLESDLPDIIGLFKLLTVRFVVSDSLLEKICDYIDICSKYLKIKLFIFVNLKSFLNESEIIQFYTHLNYNKNHVLMIENMQRSTIKNENIRIIDNDLCEISVLDSKGSDIY
jgi:CRISPR type II-A/NMEMI-associated protein Csn2